ncbi:probable bifunctional dTTP/UTP pyrophosphatase/methyltransferase protein [Carcharodon carcharias]|uniref:probable bifunctional dTTP/UTP pyrophosphatase/methyltransferase protein n=1 Tax=Carcharodon carcharias TaxID=13397 RepID=UPI001B7DFD9D|nr:probable bifunctional dTTP/UTP pyrophosphatase/methyltransferase protein [Carcharodon carcharias]XP_041055808.1 probable bifunctional dTTP/UTP pyrophosphatase/methyltransferase protein [Carcharodon carcharias]
MVLNPVISKLVGKRVVLASASPRRREILTNVGLRFEVVPSWFRETLDKSSFKMPYDYATETAREKALEVAKRMHLKHLKTPDIVIGADTIVSIDGDILEKPADKQAAHTMLSRLSNKEHSVFTGVVIIQCSCKNDNQLETKIDDFYEETKVKFSDLSEELLWEYIHSGEPMDKAGGYGIQALGGMLVEYVHGDFLNVVGFPLNHFCKKLGEIYNPPVSQCIADHSIPSCEGLSDLQHDSENHKESETAEKKLKADQVGASEEVASGLSMVKPHSFPEAKGPAELLHSLPDAFTINEMNVKWLHKIGDLVDAFKASKVLFTASKLKVFDVLSTQYGLHVSKVAQRLEATVEGTECLLDACVSLNLLKKSSGTSQVYKNTQFADTYLVSDSENSIHDYIIYANDHIWPLFTHLDSAIKEGSYGKTADNLFQNSEQTLSFMSAINCLIKVTGNDIVTAFDLSSFKTACDLGCAGALTYQMANAYQDMTLIVFNQPQMLEKIKYFQPQGQNLCRITFKEGDLFTDDLPEADLYILSNILHLWAEDEIDLLLSRLSQRCKPGGGLLLAELVLCDRKTKSSRAALQSLNTFVQSAGRERGGSEYRKLLNKYGFTAVQIKHTEAFLDAIFCIKQ